MTDNSSKDLMETFANQMANDFTTKQETSSKPLKDKVGGFIRNFNPLSTKSTDTSVGDME